MTVAKTQTVKTRNQYNTNNNNTISYLNRPRIVNHDNFRAISAPKQQEKPLTVQRRSSSVSEGAWKNSLRQKDTSYSNLQTIPAQSEKLLPAIPNPNARARTHERRSRARSLDRSSRRRSRRYAFNAAKSSKDEEESSGESKSNSSPRGSSKKGSPDLPRRKEFAEFSRRNKLDSSLTDDLASEIISRNTGVSWKDIAGNSHSIAIVSFS